MKLLEERIKKDGNVLPGNVLKVDSFLSQKLDTPLLGKLAEEWKRLFDGENITKIVTIENSGIGLACVAGLYFDVPVVYAKKSINAPLFDDYSSKVVSYTHGNTYYVTIPKIHLDAEDRILIIDDFLANGSALRALITLCESSGAKVVGAGIAIEKAYKKGGEDIRGRGYRIESLAKIKKMDDISGIEFC